MPRPPRPPSSKAPRATRRDTPEGGQSHKGARPGERIAKVLARAGVASRREAEAMIAAGRIQVNGQRLVSPALNVGPGDRILVDGKALGTPEPARLWLYHKPLGLVTSARDEKGRQTVFDALPEGLPRVVSVGRLDINSEGLLLLTNDGGLKRRLELPATGWLRKYRVRVKGTPQDATLEPLRRGIVIEGERFQPMTVAIDRQQGANAWLTVGIREGRNREVRRAMEAVGLVVNRLIRISYGPFQLGDLAPGAIEEVRARVLRDQLGPGTDAAPDDAAAPARAARSRPARPGPAGTAGKPRSWGSRSHGTTGRAGSEQTGAAAAGKSAGQGTSESAADPAAKPRSWGARRAHPSPEAPRRPPRATPGKPPRGSG